MKLISSLLERFRELKAKDGDLKEVVTKIIKEVTNISIPSESMSIRSGTVYIKTSSVEKSEIYLHKNEILMALSRNTGTGQSKIIDLR